MAIVSMNVSVNGAGTVPLGAIIPVGNVGAWALPASGEIKDGFALCDGTAFPSGSHPSFTGNRPNLTDDRFLNGTTVAFGPGGTGGANTQTLTETNLPEHTHANTLTNSTVASSGHIHNMQHYHQWGYVLTDGRLVGNPDGSITDGIFSQGRTITQYNDLTVTSGTTRITTPSEHRDQTYYTSRSFTTNNAEKDNTGAPVDPDGAGILTSTTTVGITNAAVGSGIAFSIRPKYFNVVYVMRVI